MSGEFSGEDRLLGTGAQLRAHIDELVDEGKIVTNHPFSVDMGKLLADRIEQGVVPLGYVIATELLCYDCQQGISGFTGEAMPRSVTGMPPVMYSLFRMEAQRFARGAFGDEFGDQVDQNYEAFLTREG